MPCKKYLQNLKHNVKNLLVYILSILILSVRNKGVFILFFVFLLNGQNPLSMTKVICRQSLKTWRKQLLLSSKLKFNFESSTWTVEVIRTRFPCPGLLDFLRNLFFNLKYERSMDSECYRFKFLEEIRLHWLFRVGFGEISFLKWHDVIISNSWFLAILKEFSGLSLFKLIFFS